MGRLMLLIDFLVVAASAVVFGSLNYALYALISIYITSLVLDSVLYGLEHARVAYVITSMPDEVADAIGRTLMRGATFLHGEGSYTKEPKKVILCAIKRWQITRLKDTVRSIDKDAFIIISDAREVLGMGFGAHNPNSF